MTAPGTAKLPVFADPPPVIRRRARPGAARRCEATPAHGLQRGVRRHTRLREAAPALRRALRRGRRRRRPLHRLRGRGSCGDDRSAGRRPVRAPRLRRGHRAGARGARRVRLSPRTGQLRHLGPRTAGGDGCRGSARRPRSRRAARARRTRSNRAGRARRSRLPAGDRVPLRQSGRAPPAGRERPSARATPAAVRRGGGVDVALRRVARAAEGVARRPPALGSAGVRRVARRHRAGVRGKPRRRNRRRRRSKLKLGSPAHRLRW